MAIGIAGLRVEGNEISARHLRAGNALDLGVQPRDGSFFPRHQADALRIVLLRGQGAFPPRRDRRILLHKASLEPKDDVSARSHIRKELREHRVHLRLLRLPLPEKRYDGLRHGGIEIPEHLLMQLFGRGEALQCILPLLLRFCWILLVLCQPEEIGGRIAEEIGRRLLSCPRRMIWNDHAARAHGGLLATTLFLPQVIDSPELPIHRDLQRERDAHRTPAPPWRLTCFRHHLIMFCECLKNHSYTSTPRRSRTPSRSTARKNCGRIRVLSE